MRVVVTGGSGKLGVAVVQELVDHGYDVVNVDRAPARRSEMPVHLRGSDRLRPGRRGDVQVSTVDTTSVDAVVHLAAIPGPGVASKRRYLREQHHGDIQRISRGSGSRHIEYRVGFQRDAARLAVRLGTTALHPGRRGVPGSSGDVLRAGQASRRTDGRAAVPAGPAAEDDRPAILQRDDAGRLRRLPVIQRRSAAAVLEPVVLHRPPGRRSGGPQGARARRRRPGRLHHRQRRHA